MSDDVAPEFVLFLKEERKKARITVSSKLLKEGELSRPVSIAAKSIPRLLRTAARRAARLPASRPPEIVWVQGDRELAINLAALNSKVSDGLIRLLIPVYSDQTGRAVVEVAFAVGTASQPSGLFASAYRRPNGPPLIVEAWGESLVAFAWQCLLGMLTGVAGAAGKDVRGDVLVPAELIASANGISILPMARHRFSKAVKLVTAQKTRGAK